MKVNELNEMTIAELDAQLVDIKKDVDDPLDGL